MQENNSHNANIILKKLKKSLKISTDIELSVLLNIKPNTISTWKKRDTLDFSTIIAICELYEIDLNEIFYTKKLIQQSTNLQETPLVSSELQFQYCIDNEGLIENLPKFSLPFTKSDKTRIFQVASNNMYPVIELNSFVVCESSTFEDIKNNSLVVIVSKTKGLFINRMSKIENNSEVFNLENENLFFNSISFNTADVNEIWQVKGILSYNLKDEEIVKINEEINQKASTKASPCSK